MGPWRKGYTKKGSEKEKAGQPMSITSTAPTKKWLRNSELSRYLGVSAMTLWRWKRDPALNFPSPSVVNDIEYTSVDHVDKWMRQRIVSATAGTARERRPRQDHRQGRRRRAR
jgi:predicted DNA-binding transcriptional regulator AlpA